MNLQRISPAILFLAIFACITLQNATNAQDVAAPVRGQPIELFDGTSLDGWEKGNGKKSTNWIVEDGTLHRKSKGGDLYHQHWYRDFELTFEWKLSDGGNSGVKYRVKNYGNRRLGCEYQIQDDKNPFTKQSSGGLYAIFEPNKNKSLKPVGEWNTSKIVVCGFHVEHWLNGAKVVDATFGSNDWYNRVSSSKFKNNDRFGLNRDGRIFLQDHGNPVWFRKIIVTPLDCDNTASVQALSQTP